MNANGNGQKKDVIDRKILLELCSGLCRECHKKDDETQMDYCGACKLTDLRYIIEYLPLLCEVTATELM